MSELITMKEVHEMLDEACKPVREALIELHKQAVIIRKSMGIPERTGIGWLDDLINSEPKKNGRS